MQLSPVQPILATPPAQVAPAHADVPEAIEILRRARSAGAPEGFHFAGSLSAQEAWALFNAGVAELVDVRTVEERKFVGHVPGSRHVAWMTGVNLLKNPRFLRELEAKAKKSDVILLLCRSGKRSAAAAEAASKAGFENVFNIREGFEGELEDGQRGTTGGWRSYDLPWVQD
ncbi:MAG: rhodanese-like domain-containing protein [Nitrosomonadales bacterium]|nr:rhodanese-like domain-containing protein [Nitrosomonadales bacterium]